MISCSSGIVDIWNKSSTKPVYSFHGPNFPQAVSWLGLSAENFLAVAWENNVSAVNVSSSCDVYKTDSLQLHSDVRNYCNNLIMTKRFDSQ